MIASQGTGNLELSQMLQTILRENNEEAKLKQQQKNLLANIPTFDGKDKKACLMWVNHVEHTAKQARMTFREAVTSKARPTVVTAISRYPNASDAQLKRIILESFSNVGTRTEASHYLKMMRLDSNDTLAAHNAEYEAVHTVAYGISAEEQNDEQILRAYVNTLCNYAATKLNRKIVRGGSRIKTLKDAMEEAEILDSQSRQEEISKIERDSIRDVKDMAARDRWAEYWAAWAAQKSLDEDKEKGKKRKRYDTKEEAEAAAGDDRDRDPDYVRSEEDSSTDPTYAPSRKELRRADEEGDK